MSFRPLKPCPVRPSERGVALVTTMFLIVLLGILVVGMIVAARSEMRSADAYVSTIRTDQLTEITKSAVISQIRRGTQFDPAEGISWASQPGALRSYSATSGFHRAFKLYSDSVMEVSGKESEIAHDAPPADWDTQPDHYVDLNAPILRTQSDGTPQAYFPIFDPRAAYDDPNTRSNEQVEGFSYGQNGAKGDALAGLVSEAEDPVDLRVPMPVEWLYVLRDGTLGILDEQNTFQPSVRVTKENPIVGRVAFWTDDESSKININTASEPTYWATPSLGDRDDWGWAKIPPGAGEFQRFPGHPATTAVSPVLFPNQRFADPASPNQDGRLVYGEVQQARKSAEEKGQIYDWAPKVQDIGSRSGTAFLKYSKTNTRAGKKRQYWYEDEWDPFVAAREHLYASVDEYLFDADRSSRVFSFTDFDDRGLAQRRASVSTGKLDWDTEQTIRQSRAFLTAHSRAPETTLFGTPRIALWPIHQNPSFAEGYRTHYDRLIARCATLGEMSEVASESDNSYYFRREDSQSSTTDIELERNQVLLKYLQTLTSKKVPGFGESFENKYGPDRNQILVEMFDYIRSTNLFDPVLATEGRENDGAYRTYTAGRKLVNRDGQQVLDFSDSPSHFRNGHGHVVPSVSEAMEARGFGRTVTISEVAMHFICTADGTPNQHNEYEKNAAEVPNPWRGGAAGLLYGEVKNESDPGRFAEKRTVRSVYSNFPPDPHPGAYGSVRDKNTGEVVDADHPGYKRANWNWSLEPDTPLPVGTKRVQGMLYIDYFNIAPGYNPLMMRYGVRVRGLSGLTVNGQPAFPEDTAEIWRVHGNADAHVTVGHGLKNKRLAERSPMPVNADQNPKAINHLITEFIDVEGDTMTFGATRPLELELVTQQSAGGPLEVIQTVVIQFPSPEPIPTPNLVTQGKKGDWYRPHKENGPFPPEDWDEANDGPFRALRNFFPQAPYFWSYYRKGYNNRSSGRMRHPHENKGTRGRPERGDYIFAKERHDVVYSMVPWHGDHRLIAIDARVDEDPASPWRDRVFVPIPGHPTASGSERQFGYYSLDHAFHRGRNNRQNALSHGLTHNDGGRDRKASSLFTPFTLAGLPWSINYIPGGHKTRAPQFPAIPRATQLSSRYGDFDIGIGDVQGGAFINKPDEGNLSRTDNTNNDRDRDKRTFYRQIPYFTNIWRFQETQSGFFSPNRMISSAAMMGSLPSGVKANDPWRTLLFRPDPFPPGSVIRHPGTGTPKDHLLLDLFWMPVVEPYAISEPFSTAGKINLNYQILPFTHIRRASALHGLFKGERIPSLPVNPDNPLADPNFARIVSGAPAETFDEDQRRHQWRGRFLHRSIDAAETLEDFDRKFTEEGTLFRSASEICDMYLVPELLELPTEVNFDEGVFADTEATTADRMEAYWKTHRGTADNLRERPYANLYSRITTQTNTWRIHYRVQRLKKPRQSPITDFDTSALDAVAGEQRGSLLLERYIDPNDPALPDFAEEPDATLDAFYQFRVLSTRRFAL